MNMRSVAHPIRTRLTSLLGCDYPILLPGMSWISSADLVAATTNAGGCGILATGPLSVEETRQAIRQIREKLIDPEASFGIGATLLMPGAKENVEVAIEEQVPLVNVSLGKPDWIADAVHDYGGKILATVTNEKHAGVALASGADALMCTGHEAAAHGGDVTSLVLIPSLARTFPEVPLVAAGGFATGSGLVAALALGADGVAMGSRFAISQESPLAALTKDAVVQATESDTIHGKNFDGIPARVLKTSVSEKRMKERPWWPLIAYRAFQNARALNIPLWKIIPGLLTEYDKIFMVAQLGAATDAIQAATVDGELNESGVQFIGQCQGLIHDIPHVDDIIQRVMKEAATASKMTQETFQKSMKDEILDELGAS